MDKLTRPVLCYNSLVSHSQLKLQLRMFQRDMSYRKIHHIVRRLVSQSSSHSLFQQCTERQVVRLHGPLKQMMLKYSKSPSRQIAAMTNMLIKSPTFMNAVSLQAQQIQMIHTSCPRLDNESQRDRHSQKDPNRSGREQPEEEQEDEDAKQRSELRRLMYATIGIIVMSILFSTADESHSSNLKYISFKEFYYNILFKGEVKSILLKMSNDDPNDDYAVVEVHEGAIIKGQEVPPNTRYIVKLPRDVDLEEKVRLFEDGMMMGYNDRILIKYSYTSMWLTVLFYLAFAAVMAAIYAALFRKFGKRKDGNVTDMIDMLSGGIRQAKFTRVDIASRGAKSVSFKDVAGLKEAKIEITEFVDYLTNPQRYQTLGAKTPRGALLLGPPGCGKTLLARALATEAKVPFLAMAGSEFVEMIGGVGAARVRSLFKEARTRAPCIIYIDEIDAIGRSRGGSSSSGGEDEHTLNQLLVEMDGIGTQEGVIMIAATNRADILDKALLRPGRFDRHIMIDLPTLEEREEIFHVYLEKLKLAQSPSVYAKPLAKLTPGMSGADINNICNEAAIHAARGSNKVIDTKDFEYAVERVLAGVEKRTNQLSPAEKKVVAYHESGHALVGWMLKHTDALLRISIIPRTNSALGFTQYLPSDQHLYSQEELFERMCMALGGRAAESLVFNHVSSGAHDDLNRVTEMAYNQIRSYGMNAKIGHLSFPSEKEQPGQRPYSQRLAQIMDEEARSLVAKAFLHTQTVLKENRDKLTKLAETLLEKEALNYEDVEALIGAPPHGKKSTIDVDGWRGIMGDDDEGTKPKSRRKRKEKPQH